MANTYDMVRIDPEYLRWELQKRFLIPTDVARQLGFHPAYISKTLSRGRCNRSLVAKLNEVYGIAPSTYVVLEAWNPASLEAVGAYEVKDLSEIETRKPIEVGITKRELKELIAEAVELAIIKTRGKGDKDVR